MINPRWFALPLCAWLGMVVTCSAAGLNHMENDVPGPLCPESVQDQINRGEITLGDVLKSSATMERYGCEMGYEEPRKEFSAMAPMFAGTVTGILIGSLFLPFGRRKEEQPSSQVNT